MTLFDLAEDRGNDDEAKVLAWVIANVPIQEKRVDLIARDLGWPEARVRRAFEALARSGIGAIARRLGFSDRRVLSRAAVYVGSFAPVVFPMT